MIDHVLATLRSACEDLASGLAAKATLIAAARGSDAGRIRTDLAFDRWSLANRVQTATSPHVAVSPIGGPVAVKAFPASPRTGRHGVRVSFEAVHNDPAVLEDLITVYALALLQVLDGAEAYSRAHAGTIAVLDPDQQGIQFRYGDFGGPPTSGGFTAEFTVLEQSQE